MRPPLQVAMLAAELKARGRPPYNTGECESALTDNQGAAVSGCGLASQLLLPRWRNGRRGGLKIRFPQGSGGSNPFLGTSLSCGAQPIRPCFSSPQPRLAALSLHVV